MREDGITDRLRCIVPFCKRTRELDRAKSEWICPEHWRNVPDFVRREKFRANNALRRGFKDGSARPALESRARNAWAACKKAAIEAARHDDVALTGKKVTAKRDGHLKRANRASESSLMRDGMRLLVNEKDGPAPSVAVTRARGPTALAS